MTDLPSSSQNEDVFSELHHLVCAKLDGSMSAAEAKRLEQLVLADESARLCYVRLLADTWSLRRWARHPRGASAGESDEPLDLEFLTELFVPQGPNGAATESFEVELRPITRLAKALDWHRHPVRFLSLALLLTLLGWLVLFPSLLPLRNRNLSDAPVAADKSDMFVGRLTRTFNAVWSTEHPAPADGKFLQPGATLNLKNGLAEITYHNGATVILDGPTVYQVGEADSVDGGSLRRGRLTVRVPKQAVGFHVKTPSSVIVDLGTEFGVQVDGIGREEVLVFSGAVDARFFDAQGDLIRQVILRTGNSALLDPATRTVTDNSWSPSEAQQWSRNLPADNVFIAYRNLPGAIGGQQTRAMLGHDFAVHRPILVRQLGAFDSGADGLKQTITVELWSRDDRQTPHVPHDDKPGERLAKLVFSPEEPGRLIESSRFKPLDEPLRLEPGSYTVFAYGFGRGEPAGNHEFGPPDSYRKLSSGGGAISFQGRGRHGGPPQEFPMVIGRGPANRYSAATFEFEVLE